MKVKDLIDALLEVDQDKEVMIWVDDDRFEIALIDELDDVVDINIKE